MAHQYGIGFDDMPEARQYCSSACMMASRYLAAQMSDEPLWSRDPAQVRGQLRLADRRPPPDTPALSRALRDQLNSTPVSDARDAVSLLSAATAMPLPIVEHYEPANASVATAAPLATNPLPLSSPQRSADNGALDASADRPRPPAHRALDAPLQSNGAGTGSAAHADGAGDAGDLTDQHINAGPVSEEEGLLAAVLTDELQLTSSDDDDDDQDGVDKDEDGDECSAAEGAEKAIHGRRGEPKAQEAKNDSGAIREQGPPSEARQEEARARRAPTIQLSPYGQVTDLLLHLRSNTLVDFLGCTERNSCDSDAQTGQDAHDALCTPDTSIAAQRREAFRAELMRHVPSLLHRLGLPCFAVQQDIHALIRSLGFQWYRHNVMTLKQWNMITLVFLYALRRRNASVLAALDRHADTLAAIVLETTGFDLAMLQALDTLLSA